MKLFCSALGLVLLSACSASTPTPGSTPGPAPSATAAPKLPLLVAHRGGGALAPENTLAAFKNGIALGADYIEMDVHLSKDGAAVVIHDPTLHRTTDNFGPVADFTVGELQSMNASAIFPGFATPEPIPTLAQVLDVTLSGRIKYEIEVKVGADNKRYPGIEEIVLDDIRTRGLVDRVKILAFEFETLEAIKKLEPGITTIALMSRDYIRTHDPRKPEIILDDVALYNADGIGVDKDFLTIGLTNEAHRRKMLVGVWTVDKEEDMRKFIGMGVDSITTNRPDLLSRVLGRES